jgi:hypothetical protein
VNSSDAIYYFRVQKTVTVDEVYLLFEMVKVKFVYVVDREALIGMIDMKILIDGLRDYQHSG